MEDVGLENAWPVLSGVRTGRDDQAKLFLILKVRLNAVLEYRNTELEDTCGSEKEGRGGLNRGWRRSNGGQLWWLWDAVILITPSMSWMPIAST